MGLQTGAATMENSMKVPQKIKNRTDKGIQELKILALVVIARLK